MFVFVAIYGEFLIQRYYNIYPNCSEKIADPDLNYVAHLND